MHVKKALSPTWLDDTSIEAPKPENLNAKEDVPFKQLNEAYKTMSVALGHIRPAITPHV